MEMASKMFNKDEYKVECFNSIAFSHPWVFEHTSSAQDTWDASRDSQAEQELNLLEEYAFSSWWNF